MDNLEFNETSRVMGQFRTGEETNKNSLEIKPDDDNRAFLKCHTSGIQQNVEHEVDVENVLKQKLEYTVTDDPLSDIINGNTLDIVMQTESLGLGIDITIRNNVTEDALKEEIYGAVLPTDSFTIENNKQQVLNMDQTRTSMDTQNDSVIDCIAGIKSGDELVQKEALGIDINIQKNITEDAIKKDVKSAVQETNSFSNQNIHIVNNDEHVQEVLSMEQPQADKSIQNETNDCQVTALSETSISPINARRELKVLETNKTTQNVLIGEVEKLDISEKIVNRHNESEVIVKNKSQSLKNLLVYSDDDEYDDAESTDINKIEDEKPTVSSSDSECDSDSDSDSDSESDSDSDSDSDPESLESSSESEPKASKKNMATSKTTSKVTDEQYSADLPQVADLSNLEVDYEKEVFSQIGEICSIIDKIVTITTISGTPVYDLGSIIFIEDNDSKKPLGEICDVVGPIASPMYCVGFKTTEDIKELGIKPKMKVYSAPNSNLSQYVFLKQLLEAKHTDAGLSDEDFSSDECVSNNGDERLPQKRKFPMCSKNSNEHHEKGKSRGRGRPTMKHHTYRNHQVEPQELNGCYTQNVGGGRQQTSFARNFPGAQTFFNPSIPPPVYQNNSRWINPPNAHSLPSWNSGQSSNGRQNWNTSPNLGTPPPQWNGNPSFNGVPNMPPPPPPQHWSNCSRLGFPPNALPPQHFTGYQQNTPPDPRLFTRNHRGNHPGYPHSTAPPCWQPRTHPYQPVRYGSSFPNAPPTTGSNQSLNSPGKDVQ